MHTRDACGESGSGVLGFLAGSYSPLRVTRMGAFLPSEGNIFMFHVFAGNRAVPGETFRRLWTRKNSDRVWLIRSQRGKATK
jgi:hypothetical protein